MVGDTMRVTLNDEFFATIEGDDLPEELASGFVMTVFERAMPDKVHWLLFRKNIAFESSRGHDDSVIVRVTKTEYNAKTVIGVFRFERNRNRPL